MKRAIPVIQRAIPTAPTIASFSRLQNTSTRSHKTSTQKQDTTIREKFINLAINNTTTPKKYKEFQESLPSDKQEGFKRLNPENNYPPERVKELYLKARERYNSFSPNAKIIFKRMLWEGASRGAINDEMFQGITLLYNILSIIAYDVTDPRDIPNEKRLHSPGEGGIPPTSMVTEQDIRDEKGHLLFTYGPALFESGKFQNASGLFLGSNPAKSLIEKTQEIKDQSAKQGIGGRAPKEKVGDDVQALRKVERRELPSPGQRQAFKSVEEEEINHVLAALFKGNESIVGNYGIIKNPSSVQKVPADSEANYRASAVLKAGIPVIITGSGGGTGKTSTEYRQDVQQNALLAALQTRIENEEINHHISVSGGMYGPSRRLLGLLLFKNVGGLTFPHFIAFGCIFAKLCHKSCPANITTGKMNPNKIFDALDVITHDIQLLGEMADNIGLDLSKGPLAPSQLKNILLTQPGTALDRQINELEKKGDYPEKQYQIITRSKNQIDEEIKMTSGAPIEGGHSYLGLTISDTRTRYLQSKKTPITYNVKNGGTGAGMGLGHKQTLTVKFAGDFPGYFLNGGTVAGNHLGRLAALGAQHGTLYAQDCEDGALFGASINATVGSVGDSSLLFLKIGKITIIPALSKRNESLDKPHMNTVGDYGLTANLGATILMPKETFKQTNLLPQFVEHNKVTKITEEEYTAIEKDLHQANRYLGTNIDKKTLESINDWIKIIPSEPKDESEKIARLTEYGILPSYLTK